MALGINLMELYASTTLYFDKEPVKLGLASLAIAFLKVSMTSLTPVRLWHLLTIRRILVFPTAPNFERYCDVRCW